MTHIAEAISKLVNLRKLQLDVNYSLGDILKRLIPGIENTLQDKIPAPSQAKGWNPPLAKYFKHLKNLQDFEFSFDIPDSDSVRWFEDLMIVLLHMESLEKISIRTCSVREMKSSNSSKKISNIVKEIKEVKEIQFDVKQ